MIVEGLSYLFDVPERVARKRVEPVIGDPLEIGGKHPAHKEVIVRIDCHLILVVSKMLDGVSHIGVKVEIQHHKGHDFRQEREAGILRLPSSISWQGYQLAPSMRF